MCKDPFGFRATGDFVGAMEAAAGKCRQQLERLKGMGYPEDGSPSDVRDWYRGLEG